MLLLVLYQVCRWCDWHVPGDLTKVAVLASLFLAAMLALYAKRLQGHLTVPDVASDHWIKENVFVRLLSFAGIFNFDWLTPADPFLFFGWMHFAVIVLINEVPRMSDSFLPRGCGDHLRLACFSGIAFDQLFFGIIIPLLPRALSPAQFFNITESPLLRGLPFFVFTAGALLPSSTRAFRFINKSALLFKCVWHARLLLSLLLALVFQGAYVAWFLTFQSEAPRSPLATTAALIIGVLFVMVFSSSLPSDPLGVRLRKSALTTLCLFALSFILLTIMGDFLCKHLASDKPTDKTGPKKYTLMQLSFNTKYDGLWFCFGVLSLLVIVSGIGQRKKEEKKEKEKGEKEKRREGAKKKRRGSDWRKRKRKGE
jgi:hypothetical protein